MSKIQLKNVSNMNQGIPSGPLDGKLNMREAGALDDSGLIDDSGEVGAGGEQIYAGSDSKTQICLIQKNGASGNISFTLNYSWTQGSITGFPIDSVITCFASNVSKSGHITHCNQPVISQCQWVGRFAISIHCQISYHIQRIDSDGNLMYDDEGKPVTQLGSYACTIRNDVHVEIITNND